MKSIGFRCLFMVRFDTRIRGCKRKHRVRRYQNNLNLCINWTVEYVFMYLSEKNSVGSKVLRQLFWNTMVICGSFYSISVSLFRTK